MFCVYIIFSRKLNRYYVGTTDDFVKRLAEHNDIKHPGSFTSRGIPWESYLLIDDLHSEQAYQIEEHIKNMHSKKYIQNLKRYPEIIQGLLIWYLKDSSYIYSTIPLSS
ncbi:MAG: GIY-YIG nuclease family protein [Bacteroidetes bacterium]|nr:GIY-YIG nuclease family protein [Bacteroidota bacterium]MBK7971106.1 GIY-YIG nuclease family protein [Bacteroidota bacterium]